MTHVTNILDKFIKKSIRNNDKWKIYWNGNEYLCCFIHYIYGIDRIWCEKLSEYLKENRLDDRYIKIKITLYLEHNIWHKTL